MKTIRRALISLAIFAAAFFVAVLYLVLTPAEKPAAPKEVFGFSSSNRSAEGLPELEHYVARDGARLAYRFYDSTSAKLLVFVHGSSYHGAAYHELAVALSRAGVTKVYLPNLRGHYMSGRRRGDVDYVGQLEDDVADLISIARDRGQTGKVTIGGHSSGGGFAIRFAGGDYGHLASGYLLLSPIIPTAPSVRGGDAGGWALLNQTRLFGLLAINAFGITGFNALPIIEFNKPEQFWDGTETLSYSYRLNTSYHPRFDYGADIRAMGDNVLVLVGENDEAVDGVALKTLMADDAPTARIAILPGVNHFGIFSQPSSLAVIQTMLAAD